MACWPSKPITILSKFGSVEPPDGIVEGPIMATNRLISLVPDVDTLMALQPEELGRLLLDIASTEI
jgi:hypothetical protein